MCLTYSKMWFHLQRRVEYVTTDDEVTKYHREEDVPAALQKKLVLLQRFTQYMDKFMTEGKLYMLYHLVLNVS